MRIPLPHLCPASAGHFLLTGIAMWRRRAGHAVYGAFDPPVNDCVRAIRASGLERKVNVGRNSMGFRGT
jgi:hypothetical protein